tara:strand:+ start:1793 stop:1963 length:171 start_codon:yes stop_codon:yes gene_type:complete
MRYISSRRDEEYDSSALVLFDCPKAAVTTGTMQSSKLEFDIQAIPYLISSVDNATK